MKLFSEFVATALVDPLPGGSFRYLVVDAAATRPANVSRELALQTEGTDLLTGERCDWRETASPVLIELPSAAATETTRRLADEWLAKWRYANCFTFIESFHPKTDMTSLLRERANALLPQDLPVVLRYFDSRVFDVLIRNLSDIQRRNFLSAGSRWAVPGRHGELRLWAPNAEPASLAFDSPLRLDTAQEAALIDAGDADALVDLLLNDGNTALMGMLPPEQFAFVSKALQVGKALHIDRLPDQLTFCSLTLTLGAGFHEREPWVGWLPEIKEGKSRFVELSERASKGEER